MKKKEYGNVSTFYIVNQFMKYIPSSSTIKIVAKNNVHGISCLVAKKGPVYIQYYAL